MWQQTSRKPIMLTKAKANELLQLNYEEQRNRSGKYIRYLANEIKKDDFTSAIIAIAIEAYNGNCKIMINGQHVCSSRLLGDKDIPVYIEDYLCETPSDLSSLYSKFDRGDHNRSTYDFHRMELAALELKWPVPIAVLVTKAVTQIEKIEHKIPKADRPQFLDKYRKEGAFVNYILNTSIPKENKNKKEATRHLRRGSVVYPMMITFQKAQEQAKQFWTEVRDGVGPGHKLGSPTYKLRNWLLGVYVFHGRGAGLSPYAKTLASDHEISARCITAWNAFRKGGPTDLKYFPHSSVPKPI